MIVTAHQLKRPSNTRKNRVNRLARFSQLLPNSRYGLKTGLTIALGQSDLSLWLSQFVPNYGTRSSLDVGLLAFGSLNW